MPSTGAFIGIADAECWSWIYCSPRLPKRSIHFSIRLTRRNIDDFLSAKTTIFTDGWLAAIIPTTPSWEGSFSGFAVGEHAQHRTRTPIQCYADNSAVALSGRGGTHRSLSQTRIRHKASVVDSDGRSVLYGLAACLPLYFAAIFTYNAEQSGVALVFGE